MYIVFGVDIRRPVGIERSSPGAMVKLVMELTSYPMDPGVARVGIFAVGMMRCIWIDWTNGC